MLKFFIVFLIVGNFLSCSTQQDSFSLLNEVQELTLENGMKFLLLPREGAPVFSAYIRVKVGGIDEADGQTGIAHLLEHMAFKGTSEIGTKDAEQEKKLLTQIELLHESLLKARGKEKQKLSEAFKRLNQRASQLVIKEEFSKIYSRNGSVRMNASTSQDLTTYYVSLPSHKLELWAYLESQRLKDPVFREFYSEREVVKEERRTRVEDSPFGKLYQEFMAMAFVKSPYRRPTIGYPEDIKGLSATTLKKFYQQYYSPQNIVIALVGNFDVKIGKAVIKKYFSELPAAPAPPVLQIQEPEPLEEKKITIRFPAEPMMMFGYLKPNMPHKDDNAFDVLEQLLCEGRASRLYKRWVLEEKLVQKFNCYASTPGSRLKNLFFVYASIQNGHTPEAILKSFDQELKNILENGVGESELKRVKKTLLSGWYFQLISNANIARILSYFEIVTASWEYILNHPKKIEAVTSEDLQNLVKRYLNPHRRRVAILEKEAS